MPEAIAWSDDLLVKVPAIDDDHKRLFALMNEMLASTPLRAEAINRAVEDLCRYTTFHFAREQEGMARSDYPDLETHTSEHGRLVLQLEHLIGRMMTAGPAAIDSELARFLQSCFTDHIMDWDMKYADYLRSGGKTG